MATFTTPQVTLPIGPMNHDFPTPAQSFSRFQLIGDFTGWTLAGTLDFGIFCSLDGVTFQHLTSITLKTPPPYKQRGGGLANTNGVVLTFAAPINPTHMRIRSVVTGTPIPMRATLTVS